MTDKKVLGRRSRRKGHAFEREIVNKVKARFVDKWWARNVRRSDQSHRANLPDVTGWPHVWAECETAAQPNARKKYAQAFRDSQRNPEMPPVAIVRRKGSPKIRVTMSAWDLTLWLSQAINNGVDRVALGHVLVELDFNVFLDLYELGKIDEV